MKFHIRKLTLDDLSLLQYVGRATYEPYYPHIWKPGGVEWFMEKCFGTEVLKNELPGPNTEFLLATDSGGQIVGLLKLILLKPLPDGSITNALYLEKIYLMPDYFGKGVGQELMSWVANRAMQLGREAVWLLVMKTGPVKAYERAGFENIGPTRFENDFLLEEEKDGWLMLQKLVIS